jgi:predicted MFS family arabinose efflux permease
MAIPSSVSVADEFRRGWTIIAVAVVGLACGLSAIPIYSIGTFTKPLTETFGWSRAEVQALYTWMTIGNLVAAPFLGVLIDKQGVRRVCLVSIVGMGMGYVALGAFAEQLWSFYFIGFLTAVVGVGTVPITWTRLIVDWFDAGRGRALGLALAGTGISAIVVPIFTTWVIADYGWRAAFMGLGIVPTVLALPMSLWLLHDRTGSRATRPMPHAESKVEKRGLEFREAISGYRFWIMNIVFFTIGLCVAGLIAHLVPMLTDRGIASGTAAQIAGTIGAAVIIGRIGTGYLVDRFWAPGVGLVLLSLPAISCLILASGTASVPVMLLVAALIGLAAGAEFDLMSFLVSQYFGQRRYGIIYACLYATFKISAGVGAPLFGFAFDETGSYNVILYLAAGSFIGGSVLMLMLGRYPAKTAPA